MTFLEELKEENERMRKALFDIAYHTSHSQMQLDRLCRIND